MVFPPPSAMPSLHRLRHHRWFTATIAAAIGLALGVWWSPRRGGAPAEPAVAAAPAVPLRDSAAPSSAPPALPDAAPGSPLPASPARLERARVLAGIVKDGIAAPPVRLLDGMGREAQLSEPFKVLFEITPAEERALEAAILRAQNGVTATEIALAAVGPGEGEEAGSWVIKIPAFPEVGATLYDELFNTFATTLGPERLALFEPLVGPQLESTTGSLGLQERRLVITPKPRPEGGVRFESKDHFAATDSRGWSGSSFWDRRGLDQHFGELTRQLLPPDLGLPPSD